jgi:hypothetical protein
MGFHSAVFNGTYWKLFLGLTFILEVRHHSNQESGILKKGIFLGHKHLAPIKRV